MNPEPSPSDRYAGKVIVGIYLFLIIWFLCFISLVPTAVNSHALGARKTRRLRNRSYLGAKMAKA